MINPLVNISKMTDEEIQANIMKINKKILHSSRFQSNIMQQLQQMLQAHQAELENRRTKKETQEDPAFKPGVVYDSDKDSSVDKDEYGNLIDIN